VAVQAAGKVNLWLQSSPRAREDGYHELVTVFMGVDLADSIVCQRLPGGRIQVTISGQQAHLVPNDGTDLAGRAAELLRQRFGHHLLGAKLLIDKVIPVAGGMAGGSADAAGALRACAAVWGLHVTDSDLAELAAQLGADVPFALLGNVALGTNRGDSLEPLPVVGQYHWVFALADGGLSTAAVFRRFDTMPPVEPNLARREALMAGLLSGDAAAVGASLYNALAAPACGMRPELARTLDFGARLDGVLGAVLCGSGPTAAFLCQSADATSDVAASLAALPQVRDTRVATGPAPGAALQWIA